MSQNKKRINLPAYNIGGLFDKAKGTLSGLGDTYENLLDKGEKAAESQGGKIARDVGMGLFDTTIGMGLTPFGYQGGNYQTGVGQEFKKGFSTAADINQLGAAFIPGASQIQQASSGLFEQAVPGSTTGDSFITPEMQQGLNAATSLGSMMGANMTSGGMNNTTDTTNTLQTRIPQNNLGTFGQGVGTFGTASLRAYGGKIPKYDNGGNLIKYENGGTHEQNPMGGVPVDSQGNLASITGQPPVGLVEGGETAFTNNIGETTINSDRITLTKELFNTLKEKAPGVFKKNDIGKSFADITKRIEKDYELRVDDEIAHKEKENKLEQVAEISQILAEQKAQEEQMAQQQDMPQQTTIPQQPMQQGMPMAKHGGNILHSQYHNMSQEDYDKATATYPDGGKLKERAEIPPINYTMPGPEGYAIGGKINIKPENKGKFTAKAKAAGMGVQSFANKVLKAKEGTYSPSTRKQANFARNASKWNKANGGELNKDSITEFKPYTEIDGIPVEKVFTKGDYGDYDLIAEDGEVITSGYAPPPKKIENEVAGEWRNKIKPPVWEKMDPMSRVEKIKNQNLNKNIKGPISLNRNIPIPNFKGSYTRYGNPNIPMGYVNNEGRRDTINDERMWNILNNRANGGELPMYASTSKTINRTPEEAKLITDARQTANEFHQNLLNKYGEKINDGYSPEEASKLPGYNNYINAFNILEQYNPMDTTTTGTIEGSLPREKQYIGERHFNYRGLDYPTIRNINPKIYGNLDRKPAPTFNYGGKLPKYEDAGLLGGKYDKYDRNARRFWNRNKYPTSSYTFDPNDPLYGVKAKNYKGQGDDVWNIPREGFMPAVQTYPLGTSPRTGTWSPPINYGELTTRELGSNVSDLDYTSDPFGKNINDPFGKNINTFSNASLRESSENVNNNVNKRRDFFDAFDAQKSNIGKGLYGISAVAPTAYKLGKYFFDRDIDSPISKNLQSDRAYEDIDKSINLYDKYAQAPDISQQLADIRRAELAGLQTTRDVSGGRGSAVASGSLATRLAAERRRNLLRERAEEIGTQRKLGAQQFRAGLAGQMASLGERERAEDIRAEQERIMAEAQARNIRRAGTTSLSQGLMGGIGDLYNLEALDKYGLAAEDFANKEAYNAYVNAVNQAMQKKTTK